MIKLKKRNLQGIFALLSLGIITSAWVENIMALELQSTAFQQSGNIPPIYTCDGRDVSPPISWLDVPKGTKSLILIMDDPDAPMGTWDHWLIYNIPPSVASLNENLNTLPTGASFGKNSWNKENYGGPCPPNGEHRYFFKLYAIDTILTESGMTKAQIEQAIKGHVLAQAELVAKYQRPK